MNSVQRWITLLIGLALCGYALFAAEYLSTVSRHRDLARNSTTYVNLERLVKDVSASHSCASLVFAQSATLSEDVIRSSASEFINSARSAAKANTVPALEFHFGPILSGAAIVEDAVSKSSVDVGKLQEGLDTAGDMIQILVLIVGEGRKAELINLSQESHFNVVSLISLLSAYAFFVAGIGYLAAAKMRGVIGRPPGAHPEQAGPSFGPSRPLMITVLIVVLGFVLALSREQISNVIPGFAEQPVGIDAAYHAYKTDNVAAALRIAQPLAEQGDARAQTLVGLIFHLGREVPRDELEARSWFLRAAEQGDPDAPFYLGRIYFEGRGVPQDFVEAARWYRMAAERKNPTAQYNLGIIYWNGKGVQRDKISAYVWFNLAAAGFPETDSRGRAAAIRARNLVAHDMSPEEIAEGQRRAREWKPK